MENGKASTSYSIYQDLISYYVHTVKPQNILEYFCTFGNVNKSGKYKQKWKKTEVDNENTIGKCKQN